MFPLRTCGRGEDKFLFPELVHSVLIQDLAWTRVSVKLMTKLLITDQKQLLLEVLQDILKSVNGNPNYLITIDETGNES